MVCLLSQRVAVCEYSAATVAIMVPASEKSASDGNPRVMAMTGAIARVAAANVARLSAANFLLL